MTDASLDNWSSRGFHYWQEQFDRARGLIESDDHAERQQGVNLMTATAQAFARIANDALWTLEQLDKRDDSVTGR